MSGKGNVVIKLFLFVNPESIFQVLIVDSRSFLEYNDLHIQGAVNVCCSKLVKRRLQQDKVLTFFYYNKLIFSNQFKQLGNFSFPPFLKSLSPDKSAPNLVARQKIENIFKKVVEKKKNSIALRRVDDSQIKKKIILK
jgi:hypothetical protein